MNDFSLSTNTICLALVLAFSFPASAAMFKCKDQSGAIEYSGSPCIKGFQWDGARWIDVNKEISANREIEKTRREKQFQAIQKCKAAEAENSKSRIQVTPNPEDLRQAESFLSKLPSGCSKNGKYVSDDGAVNVYFDCKGSRSVSGEIAIKNGIIRNIR